MTEPRTPDDGTIVNTDSPTQAWPSPAGPASPYEPAEGLPATRVGAVGDGGTLGAQTAAARRGSRLRWGIALVAVLVVALGSYAIVSLVGGRPSTSTAMGYMPATIMSYQEVRLDLPGDQRQKLASFLSAFPGFKDQSAIEPKIDEVFDRIVKAASKDTQTWTADIKPWFGGALAIGAGVPQQSNGSNGSALGMSGIGDSLAAVTITDRSKAIDWVLKTAGASSVNRDTYNGADLLTPAGNDGWAIAVNDTVLLAGTNAAVKAAIDTAGKGTFDQNDDVKAALATLDKDFVMFGVVRTRAYADSSLKMMEGLSPGALASTQIDETVLSMLPAWQATTARFDNDSIVVSTAGPSWATGASTANEPSDVVGHVPAKTLFYADIHDVGPNLTALLAKFRELPEAKPIFAQVDQALSILGGSEAVYGWWGDTALVMSDLPDGTIGGGLVIHPRDPAAATRLFTTLEGFIALGGSSQGIASRSEDHNGTKITILDLSGMAGANMGLPPGYKAEIAWATNADVAVIGYGSAFVKEVLDAGPGRSLGDDARFKGLLAKVGPENLGVVFADIVAIRAKIEPLVQAQAPAEAWTKYATDVQPYLAPLDALISGIRKDNGLDRGTGALTVH